MGLKSPRATRARREARADEPARVEEPAVDEAGKPPTILA